MRDMMRTGTATLIAYAQVHGWKQAINLLDTHWRIAEGDDELIDTVEAMHWPSWADSIWEAARDVRNAYNAIPQLTVDVNRRY